MSSEESVTDAFLLTVLDAIERKEARLLVWGVADGRLSPDELIALIDPLLDQALTEGLAGFLDANDVSVALRRLGLLFEADDIPYPGLRSRMAETVRLLFRLRQTFPKHAGPDGWQNAATLVSDFRFLLRRRRYPQRSFPLPAVMDKLSAAVRDRMTRTAFRALLSGKGDGFRLAAFQVRAATRIASQLEARRSAGTLVSAGTGSGKTLAFYLPALARTASHLARDGTPWVKVLAVYPRNELLRDQFAEVYREARQMDNVLAEAGARKIRIGCLFSGTPDRASSLDDRSISGWTTIDGGIVCGYLPCPQNECSGDLMWPDSDRRVGRERLVCCSCGTEVGGDQVVLTRSEMRRAPPDILFSTTEMLNQRMSDSSFRHLFGLPPQAMRPVEMMLLDEVHTYTGFHGAQVAYLLRRWLHLVRAPISFIGLSATLRDGARFFARLTGLTESQVEEVAPRHDEMFEEGAEYMLALRGDPVSRASLLSTTIQTAMLISRALDHEASAMSGGLYGSRTFVFTDDIDVTNRLYFNLLDAEGRNYAGNPDMQRHPNGPLAALRRPVNSRSRERFGQNWTMPLEIGHRLDERKRVGRTSSQDPGVATGVDVVVATASLEVGFNDSEVGAIIQHKAPRTAAQFLQRKGRAGRPRRMRPWMIVVLSDYGRDRFAYQGYDRLFDPELPTPSLPLSSRYIQRLQSVYSLIDYLGLGGRDGRSQGNVWRNLAGPDTSSDRRNLARQTFLVQRLAAVLKDQTETEALAVYLSQALRLSSEEVLPLLWEYPRPLMTAVIPTALRRLSTNWRRGDQSQTDYQVFNSPLPEFVPSRLFSDLNLPEVSVIVPPAGSWDNPDPQQMSVSLAMRTFAPGRVSHRFGVRHGSIRHWVGPDTIPESGLQEINVDTFYDTQPLGQWLVRRGEAVIALPVLRAQEVRPVQPPRPIRDTSNARLIWHTQIVAAQRGLLQVPPGGTPWGNLIVDLEAFLHGEQTPVSVRRFAAMSEADIQVDQQGSVRVQFCFQQNGAEVALGFNISADALRLHLALPPDLWRQDLRSAAPMWRALRTARFFDLAWSSDHLAPVENPFVRKWLAEIYFTAVTFDALTRQVSLREADAALADNTATLALSDVLATIFQSPLGDTEDADQTETDQLRQDLESLLHDPDILNCLRGLGRVLWESVGGHWEDWLRERFKATVGSAALEAIRSLCPEIDEDGLVVDCDPGPRGPGDPLAAEDGNSEVWISETTPGGTGHIQAFLQIYAEDPRRFYLLMAVALRPTDQELVDHQLMRFLELVVAEELHTNLAAAEQEFRAALSHDDSNAAMARLRQQLRQNGFVLFHGFISALANRLLRPGTSAASDAFLRHAVDHWDREEERLGIELNASVIAYALGQGDAIDKVMAAEGLTPPDNNLLSWRHNSIYGLLWPRGAAVRRSGLGVYNPFEPLPDAERLMVAQFLAESAARVSLEAEDWRQAVLERLAADGTVIIVCAVARRERLAEALNFLATNPVESEYLSVFARISALQRVGETFEADLEIAEFAQ